MQQDNFRLLDAEILGHGIDPTLGQNEIQILGNLVRAVRRAWRWIFMAAFIGGIAAYLVSYLSPVKYTSEAQVMINTRVSVDTAYTPVVSDLPTSTTVLESELEVLRSFDLIERIVDKHQLLEDPEFSGEADEGFPLTPGALIDLAKSVIKSFLVDGETGPDDKESSLIDFDHEMTIARVAGQRTVEQVGNVAAVYAIRFTSLDQNKAAVLANALAAEYLNVQTEAKLRSLELSQGWLTARTSELQQELSELGLQLEQHILNAPYSVEEIQLIKAQGISAERRMQKYHDDFLAFNSILNVLATRDTSQVGLLSAAEAVTNKTPELTSAIADVKSSVEGADRVLEIELNNANQGIVQQRDQLVALIEDLQPNLDLLRESLAEQAKRDSETNRIENRIRVLEAIYEDFLTQLSRRTQQDQYLDADARIISRARPPLKPSEPGRSKFAIASALVMALIAIFFAILRELMQNRMRTAMEIEEVTGFRVLGIIPEARRSGPAHGTFLARATRMEPKLSRFTRKLHSSLNYELKAKLDSIPSIDRSERAMKSEGMEKARIIAGASTLAKEGQSTAMLFLANTFASTGERVLLMDCDFWNSPYVNLEASGTPDFSSVIADPNLVDNMIVDIGWSGLKFLPAMRGDEKSTAQLGTADFAQLLDYLARKYDRILLDTPPLLSMIDSAPICKQADDVIFFVRWNSTPRGATSSALQILRDIGVTPLAAVTTRMDLRRARSYGDRSLIYLKKSYMSG